MKKNIKNSIWLLAWLCAGGSVAWAENVPNVQPAATVARFEIKEFVFAGITLLQPEEINAAVSPFLGKNKDFSDVQHALEAIEKAYQDRDYSAVSVVLPEQDISKGIVQFNIFENKYGKINVTGNQFYNEENIRNALPSMRTGNPPQAAKVSEHMELANQNPSRNVGVTFKAGQNPGEVDVDVKVTDSKPTSWGINADNTGSKDTGRARVALTFRHDNVLNKDHQLSLQLRTSPTHVNSTIAVSGGYKIPFYEFGDTLDLSASYSRVNALIGGLDRQQGGGQTFGMRYRHPLDKEGEWSNTINVGMDWRNFRAVDFAGTTLYNEIHVSPFTAGWEFMRIYEQAVFSGSLGMSVNMPYMNAGDKNDFLTYDQITSIVPDANYKIRRYTLSYFQTLTSGAQLRVGLDGQYSNDNLVQNEQIRLGGAYGVRGFSEGSEGGDRGYFVNLEAYTPVKETGKFNVRGLVFVDGGRARTVFDDSKSAITSTGLGMRVGYSDKFNLNLDAGRIYNPGNDSNQQTGDWRMHLNMSASF